MARHGSLCLPTIRSGLYRTGRGWTCALILAWMMADGLFLSNAQAQPPSVDAQFRLQWPAESDRQDWVRVELVQLEHSQPTETISGVRNQSRSPMSTGAFHLSDDHRVMTFRPRGALRDGGVEFHVTASTDAQLSIQVVDRSKFENASNCFDVRAENRAIIVPIKALLDGARFEPQQDMVAQSGSKWSLQRVENDRLRIELDRRDALYDESTGSKISIRINGMSIPELANQAQQLYATIHRVSDDAIVARKTWSTVVDSAGNTDEITWQQDIPARSGVYEIRCELKQPESRIWPRLLRQDSSIVTTRPFVVIAAPTKNPLVDAREWREIALIRPADSDRPGLNQWLPANASRLNPLASTPPGNTLERGEHAGQTTAIIGPLVSFETLVPTLVPGLPQRATFRYPAIPNVRLRVEVIHPNGKSSPDFVLAQGTFTATEGAWHQHTFAYYPGDGEVRIRVTNLSTADPAMIESISVQAGPAQFHSLDLNDAARGDDSQRMAIFSLSGFDWVDSFTHDIDSARLLSRYSPESASLYRLMIATKRLEDYLRSAGMNGVVIPAIANNRAWYEPSVFKPTRLAEDEDALKLKLCMRLLESSPLHVFAGIETLATFTDVETWIDLHADQLDAVIRKRSALPVALRRDAEIAETYNPLHLAVQASILTLTGELNDELREFKNYAGVYLPCSRNSHLSPLQSTSGFDELTLDRFASSPMVAEENVPRSPALARVWAAQDAKQRFAKWKTNQLCGLYRLISDGIDGKTILGFSTAPENLDIYPALVEYRVESTPGVAAIKSTNSSLVVLNEVRRVPVGSLPNRLRVEKQIQALEYSMNSEPNGDKIEVGFCIGDSRFQDTPSSNVDPLDSAPQPALRHRTSVDVAQILERSDPGVLMFDSSGATATVNLELAQMLRGWVALPIESVSELEAPDPTAATARLRFGHVGDHYFLMVANLAPWPSEVLVQTSAALAWRPAGVTNSADMTASTVTASTVSTGSLENNGLRTRLKLQPLQMVVLQADAIQTGVQVLDWYARARGGKEQLDTITEKVSKIVDRLGGLADPPAYESLSNGSFESESNVGLVGWLHTQHPPGAVRIDDNESTDGERSALLSTEHNDGDRTWLVSEMIPPPRSGRLAVSLACRAELTRATAAHRLRISIEGTREGEPIRQSSEIEVPHNGQWRPRQLVLEVEGVDPSSVDLLRLTIDSLSKGRVWIDDVRLHDWFPVSKERGELQAQAYVAVQGLQRGNLTPAARLIQNEWAQHLLTMKAPAPPDVIEFAEPEEPPAGVAERLRNWLPSPLRF